MPVRGLPVLMGHAAEALRRVLFPPKWLREARRIERARLRRADGTSRIRRAGK